ncbi:hypothetical protein BV22DRAFT_1048944 [Leucogyrophana mollusca]|uniref:Uncharacterized protein n=1 Tax=Leucogyrophana mollusca TaxID=85980 RepID=A0ACB8BAY6_9AGAM|nr:hypothetical protein BV22DRAFT_1048944 [Leucogyrophana mollusca]
MSWRGTSTKFNGLSKLVITHSFRHSHCQLDVLTAGKQQEWHQLYSTKRQANVQELSAEDRENIEMMFASHGMDDSNILSTAPPGDEGLDISHEGGEHEVFEELAQQMADLSGLCHIDPHTCCDHIETQNEHWDLQIDRLVDAYLHYRQHDSGDGVYSPSEPPLDGSETPSLTDIELIDIFKNIDNIQAQCKALCHLHDMPYRPYLKSQFSDAYDIYLELINRVDRCHAPKVFGSENMDY